MPESKSPKNEGLVYKGHPLRRIDNLIYTLATPVRLLVFL